MNFEFAQHDHILGIGQDDVVGARRRLVHQRQHGFAADVFLGDDLDAVLLLERADHGRIAVAGPGQKIERVAALRLGGGRRQAAQRGSAGKRRSAAQEIAAVY